MSRPLRRPPGAAPLSGRRRLLRVAGLGLSSYALAVCAHLAGGGGLPPWPVTAVLATVLGVAAVAATTRQRRFPFLLTVLAVQQVALHLVMSLGDSPAAMCSMAGQGHHDMAMSCTGSGGAMAMPGLPMLLAHLAATLLSAWLLARGEAWLWRVLRGAFTLPAAVCVPRRPRLLAFQAAFPRVDSRQTRPAAPRGPPGPAPFFAA